MWPNQYHGMLLECRITIVDCSIAIPREELRETKRKCTLTLSENVVVLVLVVPVDNFTYIHRYRPLSHISKPRLLQTLNEMENLRVRKDRLSRHGNDTLYERRRNASRVHVASDEKTVENLLPHRCKFSKNTSWRPRGLPHFQLPPLLP